jgi:putative tryptophan/tyrosine transport system substrate-binding protein
MLTRRSLLAGAAATLALPRFAHAQFRARMVKLALVEAAESANVIFEGKHPYWGALLSELRRLGHVEGGNLTLTRWTGEADLNRYPALAQEVVKSAPDLIVTRGAAPLLAALKAATTTIPVVTVTVDPVGRGLTPGLALAGGNFIGVMVDPEASLTAKRLQLLKQTAPQVTRIAYLDRRDQWESTLDAAEAARAAAPVLGITLTPALVEGQIDEATYTRAFGRALEAKADGLYVGLASENISFRKSIVGRANFAKLPAIYPTREFVDVGGLMSYGSDLPALYKRAAGIVDRIVKGARPSSLRWDQAAYFELVIHAGTAKAQGLTFPPPLLALATEVLE